MYISDLLYFSDDTENITGDYDWDNIERLRDDVHDSIKKPVQH